MPEERDELQELLDLQSDLAPVLNEVREQMASVKRERGEGKDATEEYADLMTGFTLSVIGLAYLFYARKVRKALPAVSGVGLMGISYLVEDASTLLWGGIVLCLLPVLQGWNNRRRLS